MEHDPIALAAARGQRAALCDEFIGPILKQHLEEYNARVLDILANELDRKTGYERAKTLAVGIKVLSSIENGLNAAIEAGRVAQQSLLKTDRIERMGAHERRLMDIVPRI